MTLDIPNYRVVERIGSGADTAIYRARCMRTGTDYAIKTAKVRAPEDMKVIDLMRDEYTVGSRLDHPVIRKVYEFRLIRQRLRTRGALLFMEYVPGISMSDKNFKASLADVLRLFARVAAGLAAMHRAGYVHADMKPGNIIVTPEGDVKLIDLGQSCKLGEVKPRIQGTIDYMAPEQALRNTIDQRTDVFGLGAALHRVLTGKPVPTEMNQTVNPHSQRLLGKRVEEAPQPVLTELPLPVAKLIDECCRSSPDERPSDIIKVQQRLVLAHAVLTKPQIEDEFEFGEDDEHAFDDRPREVFTDDELSAFLNESAQDEGI
ncbi:MAG: serine/threonine protein kinase [Phycisphaerales bacterium]|nr:MAG: serine/threonine protein kinase [Phycisphaerales bacterium]